ncbi:MAG: hypothetical protein Q8N03_03720 [Ignavibacteria bacterium]|jgi:hypothetical protein|nr:hypothetical protein [Ignavibacteria bacterium]
MKTNYKNTLAYFVLTAITLVVFVLGYVGLKLQIDFMQKQIVKLNEYKIVVENDRLSLIAQYQILSSEERIKQIASEELGLTNQNMFLGNLEISKERISEIEELVKIKNEY